MAVTATPRLGLKKQDAGDSAWHTALNSGMDDADARFMTTTAGTPVGVQQGFFVGQLHMQTSTPTPTVWICTVVGSPGTWILFSQLVHGYSGVLGIILLNNLIALQAKDFAGVARNLAHITAADKVLLGSLVNLLTMQTNAVSALKVDYGAGEQTVWHAGNDGVGSLLDAGLFEGLAGSSYVSYNTSVPRYFESSEQTLAFPSAVSVAHGLVTVPRLWEVVLRCKIAEGGYAVNDELVYTSHHDFNNAMAMWANATNIGLATSIGSITIENKAGSAEFTPTPANWRWVLRAWK